MNKHRYVCTIDIYTAGYVAATSDGIYRAANAINLTDESELVLVWPIYTRTGTAVSYRGYRNKRARYLFIYVFYFLIGLMTQWLISRLLGLLRFFVLVFGYHFPASKIHSLRNNIDDLEVFGCFEFSFNFFSVCTCVHISYTRFWEKNKL